jgi:hypothetical protein
VPLDGDARAAAVVGRVQARDELSPEQAAEVGAEEVAHEGQQEGRGLPDLPAPHQLDVPGVPGATVADPLPKARDQSLSFPAAEHLQAVQSEQVPGHAHGREVGREQADRPKHDVAAESPVPVRGEGQVAAQVEVAGRVGDCLGTIELDGQRLVVEAGGGLNGQRVRVHELGIDADREGQLPQVDVAPAAGTRRSEGVADGSDGALAVRMTRRPLVFVDPRARKGYAHECTSGAFAHLWCRPVLGGGQNPAAGSLCRPLLFRGPRRVAIQTHHIGHDPLSPADELKAIVGASPRQ